MIYAFNLKAY